MRIYQTEDEATVKLMKKERHESETCHSLKAESEYIELHKAVENETLTAVFKTLNKSRLRHLDQKISAVATGNPRASVRDGRENADVSGSGKYSEKADRSDTNNI